MGSGIRLDHAALKGTLWAVGSCFHATTALMAEVNIFYSVSKALCLIIYNVRLSFFPSLCLNLTDDLDDWDLEVFPKPSEVQNDLYAGNEDEEDEGEDLEGRKVTVRCCQNLRI